MTRSNFKKRVVKTLAPLVLAPLVFSTPQSSFAKDTNTGNPFQDLGNALGNISENIQLNLNRHKLPSCYDPNNPFFKDLKEGTIEFKLLEERKNNNTKLDYCDEVKPTCYNPENPIFNISAPIGVKPIGSDKKLSFCKEITPTCYSSENPIFNITPPLGVKPLGYIGTPCAVPVSKITSVSLEESPAVIKTTTYEPNTSSLSPNFENKSNSPQINISETNSNFNTEEPKLQLPPTQEKISSELIVKPRDNLNMESSSQLEPQTTEIKIVENNEPIVELKTEEPKATIKEPIITKPVEPSITILPALKGNTIRKEPNSSLLGVLMTACAPVNDKGKRDPNLAINLENLHNIAVLNNLYSKNPVLTELINPETFQSFFYMNLLNQALDEIGVSKIALPDNCDYKLDSINALTHKFDVKLTSKPGEKLTYQVKKGDTISKIAREDYKMSLDKYLEKVSCENCEGDFNPRRIFPGNILAFTLEDSYKLDLDITAKSFLEKNIDEVSIMASEFKGGFSQFYLETKDGFFEWFNKEVEDTKNAYLSAQNGLGPYVEEVMNNEELQKNTFGGLGLILLAGFVSKRRKEIADSLNEFGEYTLSTLDYLGSLRKLKVEYFKEGVDNSIQFWRDDFEKTIEDYTLFADYIIKKSGPVKNSSSKIIKKTNAKLKSSTLLLRYATNSTSEKLIPICESIANNPKLKSIKEKTDKHFADPIVRGVDAFNSRVVKVSSKGKQTLDTYFADPIVRGVDAFNSGIIFPFKYTARKVNDLNEKIKLAGERASLRDLRPYYSQIISSKGYFLSPEHYIGVTMVKENHKSVKETFEFLATLGEQGKKKYVENLTSELNDHMNKYNQRLGNITYILGEEKLAPVIAMAEMRGISLKSQIDAKNFNGERYIPSSTVTQTYGRVKSLEKKLSAL